MSEFKSSGSYYHFAEAVTYRVRHFWPTDVHDFLQVLLETSEKRHRVVKKGHVLWRAQLGEGEPWPVNDEQEPMPVAHPPERMRPRPRRATEGRANPKGIPYLYLADDRDTAMAEVRPWIGASVSVAQFRVARDLQVVHIATEPKTKGRGIWISFEGRVEPSPAEREDAVWRAIDTAFAQPIERGDDSAHYVPTQVIAEFFRYHGLDGIVYRSGLGTGVNVVLFDLDAAQPLNGFLLSPRSVTFAFDEISNPYFIKQEIAEAKEPPDSSHKGPESGV